MFGLNVGNATGMADKKRTTNTQSSWKRRLARIGLLSLKQ
jgi:hypothetical protein